MGYSPWDDGLPFSTVNIDGGPTVLAVWGLIVASKDQDGVTNLNPGSIMGLWSNSREPRALADVQAAWDYLASPDERSKNREEGGRRIIPTGDGRWRVVSHGKYREKYALERRRRQLADAQKRHREKKAGSEGVAVELETVLSPHSASMGGPAEVAEPISGSEPGATAATPSLPARIHVTREETGQRVPLEQAFVAHEFIPTREKRRELELEALELASEVALARGLDPMEVFAEASSYTERDGTERRKTNAVGMTNDRLLQTLTELRASARVERAKSAAAPAAMDAKHEEALVIERIAARRRA